MSAFLFLEKVDEKKAKVMCIHNFPEQLSEEEKQGGVLVDSYNEPKQRTGKMSLPFYNYETKEVFFEFVDAPSTEVEQLKQQLEEKEQLINELTAQMAILKN